MDAMFGGEAETPNLFDQIREGLGTENMSLDEMILEMRQIRETAGEAR